MKAGYLKAIKRLLWLGTPVPAVAKRFKLSEPMIYHIMRGIRWAEIAWPDGSTGAMSDERKKLIEEARRRAAEKARVAI